jgi:hypothetical protein
MLGSVLVLGAQSMPSVAVAQSSTELLARRLFQEGIELEREQKWNEALERFRRSAELSHPPPATVLFHVGLCEGKVGRVADAVLDLTRARDLARTDAKWKNVEAAADVELADLKPRVPTLEIHPPPNAKPTKLTMDGATLQTAVLGLPLPVNPGDHEIAAEFATGTSLTKVNVVEKQNKKVTLEPPTGGVPSPVAKPPPPPPPVTNPPVEQPVKPEPTKTNIVPWLVVGGGVAMFIPATIFFLKRETAYDDANTLCGSSDHDRCDPSHAGELKGLESDGRRFTVFSGVFAGVGAVAIAGGVYLLLTSNGKPAPATGTVKQGARSSAVRAFVAPLAAPGGGGAVVVGQF